MRKLAFVAVVSIGLCSAGGAAAAAAASGDSVAAALVEKNLQKGYRLAEEKKIAEAILTFNSVLKTEPENHAALVALGYLYSGVKQWKAAVKKFQTATAQDPADQRLRMDFAYALEASGDLEGAGAEFARLAGAEGEFQAAARAALEAVQSAAAASPADVKGRKLLERGYMALSKGDKAAASGQFEAAVKLDPKNTAALKQLGFLNLGAGKLQAAADFFEAARAIEPDDYFTALQLGYTYAKLKKNDAARVAFTAAAASTDAKIRAAAVAALQPATAEPEAAENPSL